jgi:hypothetical protein
MCVFGSVVLSRSPHHSAILLSGAQPVRRPRYFGTSMT